MRDKHILFFYNDYLQTILHLLQPELFSEKRS